MDWEEYDLQECEEPFDAVRRMAAPPPPAGAGRDRLVMETKVQVLVRIAKDHAGDLGSTYDAFRRAVECDIPAEAVSHCRLRYESNTSTLLRWHYCLALHVAERRGEWLDRAIGLMLESAGSVRDERRASSYLVIAHNLSRWHGCRMGDAVARSALRFGGSGSGRLAQTCASVVACAEKSPEARDAMRDAMIRRAACSGPLQARHFLGAAIMAAKNKGPARLACMRLYERCADGCEDPPRRVHDYNEALRHAEGIEDRQRLAGRVLEAARLAGSSECAHACTVPAQEIPGRSGLERARGLAAILSGNLMPALAIRRGGGDAGCGEEAVRWARFLAAYISSIARACEYDGRISAGDHVRCIASSGLGREPAAEALIRAGIERHYEGDYASSIHILLPQVESTLRALLERSGAGIAGNDSPAQPGMLRSMIEGGEGILGSNLAAFLCVWLADAAPPSLGSRVRSGLYGGGGDAGEACALPRELNHGTSLTLILVIELLSGMCKDSLPPGRNQ